jgi:hypothetical protein
MEPNLQLIEKQCATCPTIFEVENGTEWKTQCKDCFMDERTKRACKICGQKKICVTEPTYKEVCAGCYKDAPMKPCTKCKQYVLKAFEWRTMCHECFKKADFDRPCQVCKVRPIATHLPSYVTKCGKCFLEEKQKTHDACPWCPPDPSRRFNLNKRKEAPGCRTCMEKKGMLKLFGSEAIAVST